MPTRPLSGSKRCLGVISGLNPAPVMPSLCSNLSKLNQNCDSTLWVQCKETLSWEFGGERPPPPFNRPLAPVEQEGEINTLRCPPPGRASPRGRRGANLGELSEKLKTTIKKKN